MNTFPSTLSTTYTYRDSSVFSFNRNENDALSVTIDTKHLRMRSIKKEDCDSYVKLFGDREVMRKFGYGETRTKGDSKARLKNRIKSWKENDPYNNLSVLNKSTNEYIGQVTLGHGDYDGNSELSYLFFKNHWGKGYGAEAVNAVVKDYSRATVHEGYTRGGGRPLESITAIVRTDNLGSVRILEKIGMNKIWEGEEFYSACYKFSIDLKEFSKKV